MNINVTASIPHTEFDRSSTLIYVPEQVNKMHSYGFEIKLNYFTSMVIRLITGTTIIYSAYMITHQQIKINNILSDFGNKAGQCVNKRTSEETSNDIDFINISTYYSAGLYSHIKSSINRFLDQKNSETSNL